MKKQFLLSIFTFCILHFSFSQNPLVKQWDKRFGGTYREYLTCFKQANDGGYILGGYSYSDSSGDKTQDNWDSTIYTNDFWIVKTNSLGSKQWDRRFGGTDNDELSCLQQTTDGGYILGGYSKSLVNGDKTQANRDTGLFGNYTYDYWVVKIDSIGNKQWDKVFGGSRDDKIYSLQQTSDGGYIFGGYSDSDSSGDKTQNLRGWNDFWVVKTDSLGNKQWDKDFGGMNIDKIFTVHQTTDGGYILGGYSASDSSGDKTQNLKGGPDYWIVKTDSLGIKQWDKDFGGTDVDNFNSLQQTADGGYILGGSSFSGVGGDKTQPKWGGTGDVDYWVVKTDSLGIKQWDKDFGGTNKDELGSISQTSDYSYLLAGDSYSDISGDKTEDNLSTEQTWIIKTDSLGIKQWDKTLLTVSVVDDENGRAIQTNDGCYAMANYTGAGIGGYKTQPNWDTIPPLHTSDYWIIKFCDTTSTTSITQLPDNPNTFSIYPNPAKEYITINYHFKTGDEIRLTDVLGKLFFTTKIKTPSSDYRLPTSDLSPGIYFLKAGNEVRKFVKE